MLRCAGATLDAHQSWFKGIHEQSTPLPLGSRLADMSASHEAQAAAPAKGYWQSARC